MTAQEKWTLCRYTCPSYYAVVVATCNLQLAVRYKFYQSTTVDSC